VSVSIDFESGGTTSKVYPWQEGDPTKSNKQLRNEFYGSTKA
jgi:hypothetical protein